MRPHEVVEIHSLRGTEWQSMNGRLGVVEWTDGNECLVNIASDEKITLGREYLQAKGISVELGRAVSAVGLHSTEWKALNNTVGRVDGGIDEMGRVSVSFPPPWGSTPLLLRNISKVSEGRALLSERATQQSEEQSGIGYMFREGTLVEAFGLEGDEWIALNSVTGIVCDGIVQEIDAARVPVAFPEPWGDLPLLVDNIRPSKHAKYVTVTRDPADVMHGMQLESTTVRSVKTASEAHRGGIVPGDIIRAVSNVPVFRSDDIVDLLQVAPMGTSFVVTLESPTAAGVSWNGKVGSKWWKEPPPSKYTDGPEDGFDVKYASQRCQDCGGAIDLGRRCPVTGLSHGASLASPSKPPPRSSSRKYSDASLVMQLADAIDAIERSNVNMYPATPTNFISNSPGPSPFPSAVPSLASPTTIFGSPQSPVSPASSSITRRDNVPLRYI